MLRVRNFIFLIAFCLIGQCVAFGAHAATVYANSATGSDITGDGTSGNPFKTFTKAYASSSSGGTIDLTGTFTWSDPGERGDATGTGFTLSKNLIIRGQGVDSTFVQASSTPNTADRSVFYDSGYTVTIQDLTIRYGATTYSSAGGGVTNSGTLTLLRVRVTENYVSTTGMYGAGGLYGLEGATMTVSSSTFDNNGFITTSLYGSGGLYTSQSVSVYVDNSTFRNNHATSSNPSGNPFSYASPSGAFGTFRFGTVRLTNCTFTGNSTNAYGGAVEFYYKDSVTITNTTIANNSAGYGAGGLLFQSESNGYNLFLKNTIIANNVAAGSPSDLYAYDAASAGRITDNGYNIIEFSTNVSFTGVGDLTGDQPNLNLSAVPADNNTLFGTQTLAISAGSVAINAGTTTANNGVAIPRRDQRNAGRNGATDIGAYEYAGIGVIAQYTLTYSAGTGTISGSASQIVDPNTDGTAVTAVPSAGYTFLRWSDGSTQNPRTDTNVTGDITVTANFAVATYALTYAAGAGGTLTGSAAQTVGYGANGSAVTAVPSAGYAFVDWSDGSTQNPRTDTNVSGNVSVTANFADSSAPVISSTSVTPGPSSAVIAWTTGEAASSQVEYGPSSSYGSITAETDTSPRVTSHSVSLASLTSCATYHVRLTSKDGAGNAATSTDATFMTTGCTGSSSVSTSTAMAIAYASSGTVSMIADTGVTVSVPANYATTSANFQIGRLSDSAVVTATGRPEGYREADSHFFQFSAITASSTAMTSFASALTVTMTYAHAEISGLIEGSLRIFRWADSAWHVLSGCSVNESTNSVTCETDHFSTFGLFGEAEVVSTASVASSAGGARLLVRASAGSGTRDASVGMRDEKDIGSVNAAGINVLAYIGSKAVFKLQGSNVGSQTLSIDEVDLLWNTVTVSFAPARRTVTLRLHESASIDLDGNGTLDLNVIFSALDVNRVELTLADRSGSVSTTDAPVCGDISLLISNGKALVSRFSARSAFPFVFPLVLMMF